MNGAGGPPRYARRLLQRALPEDVREHVVADLDEVFDRRCKTAGRARARLWYWREAVAFAGRFFGERYRERGSVSGRRGGRGGLSWLDVKLGMRMLVKYPGLTLVSALGIAVAVGLAAVWFEFSQDLTNERLPFEEGSRIVRIRNWDVETGQAEPRMLHDFDTWRRELRSIEELGAASPVEYRLSTRDGLSESVRGARVTPSTFRLLRTPPLLGRPLVEGDAEPGAAPVVVIGYDLWQRFFDGDARVVGSTVRLGSTASTVVGVMPNGFGFPVNQELWVALAVEPSAHARGQGPQLIAFGRLAEGVSREQAQAELTAIGARAAGEFPETNEQLRPRVGAYVDVGAIGVLATAVNLFFILFLLVVCANIATLVFARTVTREGEIALRTALGASRRRIVLQLFVEALVLTGLASAIGLAAGSWGIGWGMDLFWQVQQSRPPFWFEPGMSWTTAMYVAGLALFGGAVIGVIPALKATGPRIRAQLALVGSGSGLRFGAVSTGVIVVQVALSVAFLPLAVLRGQDLLPDREAAEAFPAGDFLSGRLSRQLDEGLGGLPAAERAAFLGRTGELHAEVLRRVAAEPGVAGVTISDRLPGMNHQGEDVRLGTSDSTLAGARTLAVDLDFFEVMGARVVSGRSFRDSDLESAVPVVVVGQSFVRDVLGGRPAVGQRLRYPNRPGEAGERWHEIVGIVEDPPIVRYGAGEYVGVYRPLAPGMQPAVQLYVRAASNAHALVPRIHALTEAVDRSLAVDELMSLEEVWEPVRRSDRFFVVGLSVVGGIALLLSLVGIYALMSFTVAQRVREIAIRAALGAHPRRLIVAIFSRGLAQIGLGVVVGALLISLTVLRSPEAGRIVAAVSGLMLAVGLMACALPALRALRIQPADALRKGG